VHRISATCRWPIRRASRCRSRRSPLKTDLRAPTTTPRAKGNLVAVISNGTAILGLGNLGALWAAKPVMEGKAVLFKRFADVDSIDLEVDTEDVDNSSTACATSAHRSAASTSKTSRRPNASSSSSACAS
jgi:malic enzyme